MKWKRRCELREVSEQLGCEYLDGSLHHSGTDARFSLSVLRVV